MIQDDEILVENVVQLKKDFADKYFGQDVDFVKRDLAINTSYDISALTTNSITTMEIAANRLRIWYNEKTRLVEDITLG